MPLSLGHEVFISYYPLKQGLKPIEAGGLMGKLAIYILLSIKTRIETLRECQSNRSGNDLYPTIH